jgi:DNA invertase Pin-like site-specific DNA recombinase
MTAQTTSKPFSSFALSTALESEHATRKPQGRHTVNVARKRSAHAEIQRMRVVGYCRVSTNQQAQEGVSLDAQRARIKAHCISQGIKLVDIITDDGYSAASLKRPGLQSALRMLATRKADAIVVLKLDRLTRSVKDLGYLCDTYFREGLPFYLLSVCDSIDTRSAGGKLILNVLMSVAQWEREAISERTQEAMAELKRQGVSVGGAPYGWRYSQGTDSAGRHYLEEIPEEQVGIRRICELYDADVPMKEICAMLDAEKISCRGPRWHKFTLYRVLRRAGYEDPERVRKSAPSKLEKALAESALIQRDKSAAAMRATTLRAQGLSLRQIGECLRGERILPPRSDAWHAASVRDLILEAAQRQAAA